MAHGDTVQLLIETEGHLVQRKNGNEIISQDLEDKQLRSAESSEKSRDGGINKKKE